MKVTALMIAVLVSSSAVAGGISFGKEYEGIHPINGSKITIEIASPHGLSTGSSDVLLQSMGHGGGDVKGKIGSMKMGTVETTLVVTDTSGNVIGHFVTEPPCTMAESAAFVFPSGVVADLKKTVD